MPQGVLDYFAGGALDELTLKENTAGWERLKLYYRVLAAVGERRLGTTILGHKISMPICVAPTAFHRLACEAGEVATARAAKKAGTLFILSSLSNTAMEKVFAEAGHPRWFQLYVYKDPEVTRDLVRRAENAGAEAIVLTVDAPGLGTRERDSRNNFRLPDGLAVENLAPLGKGTMPKVEGSGLAAYVRDNFKPDLGFDDLDWLCGVTRLPVVVKGVCRGDDARRAAEHGAKAVVVSNHGGRQLDRAPASIDVLEEVVAAVDGRAEVYLDSGVRRGADVLVALALGARFVFLGRPILYALAAGGRLGVARALALLRDEVATSMALLGARTIDEVTRDRTP